LKEFGLIDVEKEKAIFEPIITFGV